MAGRPGGNPNILEISKKSTGPTSDIGKLKVSMNSVKSGGDSKVLDKIIKEAGITFKKASEAISLKKLFISWFKSLSGKELTEIDKLDEVITILEADTANRVMGKIAKGIPLDEDDVKLIRLLKDCLSTSHELKFGKKQLNVHASYNDIRQMMFDDNSRSK